MEKVYSLCMIIAFVSFLGYVVENLWMGITCGYMDNRNMIFPFLFGYGLAVAAIYFVLGTPRNFALFGHEVNIANPYFEILLYSVTVMICISLGEIILGKAVEKICHIVWWDYSHLPLHVTQYTSLFTSAGFTLMIVLFMDKVFVPMYHWYLTWNRTVLAVSATALTLIMAVDFIHSAYLMYVRRSVSRRWKIDFTGTKLYQAVHCQKN